MSAVPDEERRMPFLEHLAELRTCLRNSAVAIVVASGLAYAFSAELYMLLARPLLEAWEEAQRDVGIGEPGLVYTSLTEGFTVFFKLSLLVGVIVASPVIFREIWRFISPGLYPRERRFGIAFVLVSVVLFVGGVTFAYCYVLPAGYKFFLRYATNNMGLIRQTVHLKLAKPFAIRPMLTMDEYFGLTTILLLVFGAVFELPLLLAILAMLGIVSAGALWRFNRYAIILFAVAGAVLTPGDLVVGQLAMTGALTVLYNLSILVAWMVGRKRAEAADPSGDEDVAIAKVK
jgi:sec-independent protein translocase protein TatC